MKAANRGNQSAIGYLRVSTDRQELGPEGQRAAIQAWASRQHAEIRAIYSDPDVSGAKELERREGLMEALAEAKRQKVSFLVVSCRDRLARDVRVACLIEREAERVGVRIVTADGVAGGDTPEDRLMRQMQDAFAEFERAKIRGRIRAALAVKRARGERWCCHAPYGYRFLRRRLEPEPGEQEVIRLMHRLREQGLSWRTLAVHLRELGVTNRAQRPFAASQILRVLAHSKSTSPAGAEALPV